MPDIGIILGKQPAQPRLSFKDTLRVAEMLADRLKTLKRRFLPRIISRSTCSG